MRRPLFVVLALGLGGVLALLPVMVAAQPIWTGHDVPQGFSVEWLRPEFAEGDDVSFISSALYLSGRVAVRDNLRIVGDVPFAYFDADYSALDESVSDFAVGNPYLGLELGALDRPFRGEVGIRVPLVPSDNEAILPGFFSDYDRCEAFTPDVLSVMTMGNYFVRDRSGFSARFRAGPTLWVDTDPGEFDDDIELFALYSAQGWYDIEQARFGAGITGRLLATESDLDLGERTNHHLGLALIGKFPGLQPGLHFRVPLDDDLTDVLDYAIGLNVTVPIR